MGNAQSIGTLLTKGIKVYKKIKREKERQERQQHQQQQQQQYQPHQEQQHRPPQQQHYGEGNHHHQIQQEHDDPQYSRLRDLAHQEAEKRNACYQRSQEAYHRGNGAQGKLRFGSYQNLS
jgi:ABC-type oligopeptide transport system ATPase subunit